MMRKRNKPKHKSETPKHIRLPVRIAVEPRLRAGTESYSINSSRRDVHYPTNISIMGSTRSSTKMGFAKTNQSIRTEYSGGTSANGLSRSYAGDEGIAQDDSKCIEHMSDEVIQVVEELMEQTFILKKSLLEMVTRFQQNLCQCQGYSSIYAQTASPCSCQTGSEEQCDGEEYRGRGGTGDRNSSGYDSSSRTMTLPRSEQESSGYIDFYCPDPCPCVQGHKISEQPNCFCASKQGVLGHNEAWSKKHKAFSEKPSAEVWRSRQQVNGKIEKNSRQAAGSAIPSVDVTQESPEDLARKLADAQKEIENLRKLINNFFCCFCCPENLDIKESGKKSSRHILNKADCIQKLLNEIKFDCPPKNQLLTEDGRQRSGEDKAFFQEIDNTTFKLNEVKSQQTNIDNDPSEIKTSQLLGPTEKIIKTAVDSSLREVNFIKENDVNASKGRVPKTIEMPKRVEGQSPPNPRTTSQDFPSKSIAEKPGKPHYELSNQLPQNDHSKQQPDGETIARAVRNIQECSCACPSASSALKLDHPTENRLDAGCEKEIPSSPPTRPRRKSSKMKSYSSASTNSSADNVRRSISSIKHPKRHLKQSKFLKRNEHDHNNGEEPSIDKYIHSGTRHKIISSPPDPTEDRERSRKLRRHAVDGTPRISLIACKFNDKTHSPMCTLNLPEKADSYFIEVQPKKSHSFNGVSSDRGFPDISFYVQKHASTMDIPETYACNHRASEPTTSNNQKCELKYFYGHHQTFNEKDVTTDVTGAPPALTSREQLKLTVKGANIHQIPYIINQLVGQRTPKEFFISVLPEKKPSTNLRVNVVDKETGSMLGYFFIEEEVFREARKQGMFDRYLSLFVLNSLGSFAEFVSMARGLLPFCSRQFSSSQKHTRNVT